MNMHGMLFEVLAIFMISPVERFVVINIGFVVVKISRFTVVQFFLSHLIAAADNRQTVEDVICVQQSRQFGSQSQRFKHLYTSEKFHTIVMSDENSDVKCAPEPTTDIEDGDTTGKRETWTNDWEFIMSCIALSIGLGNVWRFPFVAFENGGGAFLIPYLIVLVLIGQPIYYLELLVGQFSSRSSIKVYDMVPAFRGKSRAREFSDSAHLNSWTKSQGSVTDKTMRLPCAPHIMLP